MISLVIKNEQGQIVNYIEPEIRYVSSFGGFLFNISFELKEKFPLISHIDLYTDTYINQTQAPLYGEEFKKLSKYTKDGNLKKYCELVINELNNLEFGNFLVFNGD